MTKISIELPDELVKYLDEHPYIGNRSSFIAMLIQKFQKEEEKSKHEREAVENEPKVLWN